MISILYIPHGSDESFINVIRNKNMKMLYIPHGSDESLDPSTAT